MENIRPSDSSSRIRTLKAPESRAVTARRSPPCPRANEPPPIRAAGLPKAPHDAGASELDNWSTFSHTALYYRQKNPFLHKERNVKLPVVSSTRHKGKSLHLDSAREIVTLVGINGETLGTLPWDFIIDHILAYRKPSQLEDGRTEPRISFSIRVRYNTPQGVHIESRAGGIGGGGLFIESEAPLPVDTKLVIEFSLPDSPTEWLSAKGVVAWVCPKADQYTFSPGMGVRFTDIATETRTRVLNLIHSVKNANQSTSQP